MLLKGDIAVRIVDGAHDVDSQPNMADERIPEKREKVKAMVERTGKAKVIMCHVDNEEALRFGHSIGIAMYQGRFIDQLVAPRNAANRLR